jgi:hypothetical protein
MSTNVREQIDSLIAAGDAAGAATALGSLWQTAPGPALAAVIVRRFEQLRAKLSLTPCRLAILRSFTVEPVIAPLRAMAFLGQFLHPITGRVCKCLAVDLNNTLWGGVIGKDGLMRNAVAGFAEDNEADRI